jgi:DNA-binding transcriptional MerR regulator
MSNEYINNLTIEELSVEVEKLLKEHGLLNNQNDRRINTFPDPRTIRYYTTLGLLESPSTVNRQARYNRNHVIQLSTIKALQAESLSLAEIQKRFFGKRIEELEQVLINIAGNHKKEHQFIQICWNEITIEPGLKIMVDDLWKANQPVEEILEKVKIALITLSDKQLQKEK